MEKGAVLTTKKVDLVVYEGGKRRVIGEAVVDLDGVGKQYLDVSGVVTDPEYQLAITEHCSVALNVSAFCDARGDVKPVVREANVVRGVRFDGKVGNPVEPDIS